jgi:hypothetical protein
MTMTIIIKLHFNKIKNYTNMRKEAKESELPFKTSEAKVMTEFRLLKDCRRTCRGIQKLMQPYSCHHLRFSICLAS